MRRKPVFPAFLVLMVLALGTAAHASSTVEPGWDLFVTQTGTKFDFTGTPMPALGIIQFEGKPLNTFDFGGGIGTKSVSATDTIIRRIEAAVDPGSGTDTIAIEIVALSLVSVDPVDIGNGPEHLVVTLNSDLGDSEMTIFGLDTEGDPHGSFSSSLHFLFDVDGTVSGPLLTLEKTLVGSGTEWVHFRDLFMIQDVNFHLDGSTTDGDFHPIAIVLEDNNNGDQHVAGSTPVPEVPDVGIPTLSQVGLMVQIGLLLTVALAIAHRRRRRVKAGQDES